MEEWRNIKSFKNYQVSSHGNVKRKQSQTIHKDGKITTHKERLLKQQKNHKGYKVITISSSGNKKTLLVHRLVMSAFNPIKKYMEVNHLDGIKDNNNIENLEWSTPSQNQKHAYNIGLKFAKKGEKNGMSKLTWIKVNEIRRLYKTGNYKRYELADKYKVSLSCVKDILINRTWKEK